MPTAAGYANVNGTRLYYETAGAGTPLALIHGYTLDRRMWDDQFDTFARRHRVVRYDLRGFGRSADPIGPDFSHADDLKALLGHLGVTKAHVLGLSMGGRFAVNVAVTYPEMTRSLVAVDCTVSGFQRDPALESGRRAYWDTARSESVDAARRLWLASALFAPAMEQPAVGRRIREMVEDYRGWYWLHSDTEFGDHSQSIRLLGGIRVPTLSVTGERDLPDYHRAGEAIEKAVAGARRVVLPAVGHMSNMEAPSAFNDLVLDCLANADRSASRARGA